MPVQGTHTVTVMLRPVAQSALACRNSQGHKADYTGVHPLSPPPHTHLASSFSLVPLGLRRDMRSSSWVALCSTCSTLLPPSDSTNTSDCSPARAP
jgi:hypothetical protein